MVRREAECADGSLTISEWRCNAPLEHTNFHYDHIDPDWFSKDNELENCQVLCWLCHEAKTGTDKRNIAKSKRVIDKRIKAKKKRGFKGWRRFDGSVVHVGRTRG